MSSNSKVTRFQIKQGKLMLAYPTLPDLGCLLMELDERGCRGQVPFQALDEDVAAQWRKILKPKLPLIIKLDVPPHLNGFELEGPVSEIVEARTHTEIELIFSRITPAQQQVLSQAVLSLAMQKMRASRSPLPGDLYRHQSPVPVAQPMPETPAGTETNGADHDSSLIEIHADAPPAFTGAVAMPETDASAAEAASEPAAPDVVVPQIVPLPSMGNGIPPDPPEEQQQLHHSSVTLPSRPPAVLSRDELKEKRLGEVLIHMGQVSPQVIQEAVSHANVMGERLGRFLLRNNLVPSDVLCRALALQSGLPVTDLTDLELTENLTKVFPHATMAQHCFVPFDEAKSFVCIAVADPLKPGVVSELERACNKKIEMFLAQEDQVLRTLDKIQLRVKRKPRKYERHDVELPVTYQFCSRLGSAAEVASYQGQTVNLSEGGMLLKGPPTTIGSPEDLRRRGMCVNLMIISTPGQEIRGICQIRSIRKPAENQWLIGLEVVEMSAEDRRRYKALCVKAAHGR